MAPRIDGGGVVTSVLPPSYNDNLNKQRDAKRQTEEAFIANSMEIDDLNQDFQDQNNKQTLDFNKFLKQSNISNENQNQVEQNEQEFTRLLKNNMGSNTLLEHQIPDKTYQRVILNSSHELAHMTFEDEQEYIENLAQLLDGSDIDQEAVEKFATQLLNSQDGLEAEKLKNFLEGYAEQAKICLVLQMLLMHMRRKKKTDSAAALIDLVEDIYDTFLRQQGAVLCETFTLAQNKLLTKTFGIRGLQQLASLKSSRLTFASFSQFVQFVQMEMKGDFKKMMAVFLQILSRQITSIKQRSFEDRAKLENALSTQHFIYITISFDHKFTVFAKRIEACGLKISMPNIQAMYNLIKLIEMGNGTVNPTAYGQWQRLTVGKLPTNNQFIVLLNQLIGLCYTIPEDVFNGFSKRTKLIESLRAIQREYKQNPHKAQISSFNFLNQPKEKAKKYV